MDNLQINGTIIPSDWQDLFDWFGMQGTSPKKVKNYLTAAKGADIVMDINSPGGSVYPGLEIYSILKDYPGNVTARVMSIAASAASMIMCGGDHVLISPVAQVMIHNCSCDGAGNYLDHEKLAAELKKLDQACVQTYTIKTGKSEKEMLALMADTTFFNAPDAVKIGLADEVIDLEKEPTALKAVASMETGLMSPKMIEALTRMMHEEQQQAQRNNKELELEKGYLDYFEIKGGK